jgi:hypothetical protein
MSLVANPRSLLPSHRSHGHHDEELDQIGSNASTPPGAHTPRPDLVDKRLPSLLHSYFGQVRDSFRSRPKSASSSIDHTNIPISTMESETGREEKLGEQCQAGSDPLPTAPASPTGAEIEDMDDMPLSPLLPHEQLESPTQPKVSAQNTSFFPAYPTPPTSSNSSMHRTSKDEPHGRNASIDLLVKPTAHMAVDGAADADQSPRGSRRPTLTSSPLSNVVVAPTVTASHISNPVADISSTAASNSSVLASLSASRRASAA